MSAVAPTGGSLAGVDHNIQLPGLEVAERSPRCYCAIYGTVYECPSAFMWCPEAYPELAGHTSDAFLYAGREEQLTAYQENNERNS
jgi:hypothetical protein